jgi:hypothetical protein
MANRNLRSRLLSVEVRFKTSLQSGARDRLGKVVGVSQAQAIWLIFRVLGCLENCGSFRGAQPVSDAYLVEIGLAMSRVGCRVDLSSRRGRRGSVLVPRKSEPARFPRECDHLSGRW